MPTSSSGGIRPAPLLCRISDSTPGAILQPQPPPCEKLVRRSGASGFNREGLDSAVMAAGGGNGSACHYRAASLPPSSSMHDDNKRHRPPVRVADIRAFDTLIDARSPAEFALDHIPGAINCPVLDDEERRIVGTLYKQQGAFEARRLGGGMVAANLARHLRDSFADKPANWKPLVYCWRGGLRSGSMVTWMRLVGWDAQQLAGGYKSFRHHVLQRIEALVPQ